jgi:hypothetical protein
VTFQKLFESGSFAPGDLEFEIGFVENPGTTARYESFVVSTHTTTGAMID